MAYFKKVKGDGIVEQGQLRFIILEDETRFKIPLSYIFKFSKEQFTIIQNNINK